MLGMLFFWVVTGKTYQDIPYMERHNMAPKRVEDSDGEKLLWQNEQSVCWAFKKNIVLSNVGMFPLFEEKIGSQ